MKPRLKQWLRKENLTVCFIFNVGFLLYFTISVDKVYDEFVEKEGLSIELGTKSETRNTTKKLKDAMSQATNVRWYFCCGVYQVYILQYDDRDVCMYSALLFRDDGVCRKFLEHYKVCSFLRRKVS